MKIMPQNDYYPSVIDRYKKIICLTLSIISSIGLGVLIFFNPKDASVRSFLITVFLLISLTSYLLYRYVAKGIKLYRRKK